MRRFIRPEGPSAEKGSHTIGNSSARLLVLNHRGASLDALVGRLAELGVEVDTLEPESSDGSIPFRAYDGIVASGGYLKADSRRETLRRYSRLFEELDRPFLGICLGMKILGFCYGARIGKVPPVIGERLVSLRGFPLCPSLSEFTAHQSHRYELIRPLPHSLEDFTGDAGPVQALKVRGREQYAVQFHPEVGRSAAATIMGGFVDLCSAEARRAGQGT